jgi:hypothetical protein
LDEQLHFLESSADSFDKGKEAEAKRIAVTVRTLVHNTRNSHSLLRQLEMHGGKFLTTSFDYDPNNLIPHSGLVGEALTAQSAKYIALLDDVPFRKLVSLEDWWNEIVFTDEASQKLTRRDLVLIAANQDGGTHVDPSINETYYRLNNPIETSSQRRVTNVENNFMKGPVRAALRQIGHEMLASLKPGYRKTPEITDGIISIGLSLHEGVTRPPLQARPDFGRKVGRNEPCPCGSGVKYKRCCGKL